MRNRRDVLSQADWANLCCVSIYWKEQAVAEGEAQGETVARWTAGCLEFFEASHLSWETFMQKDSAGYKYQALRVSLDETDFRAANLVVGARRQNWLQCQAEAKAKHSRVVRYT